MRKEPLAGQRTTLKNFIEFYLSRDDQPRFDSSDTGLWRQKSQPGLKSVWD